IRYLFRTCFTLLFRSASFMKRSHKHRFRLFSPYCEFNAEFWQGKTHLSLPALRTDTCTWYTPNNGGLWGADIISIKASYRERLQNMEFNSCVGIGIGHIE